MTFRSPAENLACDEALLDWCETGAGTEVLRFWESAEHFVVVGYADKVYTEVNIEACERKGIPVYRRCSGGGTVLQGPGCLNYTLVLRITDDGPFRNITSANRLIMQRNRTAIESLYPKSRQRHLAWEVAVRGHTDLCLGHLKCSGSSQRRRKHFLLFHGTFLLNLDLALVTEVLRMPSKQPDYRKHRTHASFLTNLNLSADEVKAALCNAWGALSPLENPPVGETTALARAKYASPVWNQKY